MRSLKITCGVLYALAFGQISCNAPERGNGQITTEERSVSGFTKIEVRGNYDVTLERSDREKVVVQTDENLHDLIELSVGKNTLVIQNLEPIVSRENVRIRIFYTTLNELISTGASVISNDKIIQSDRFALKFPGTGMINLELEAEALEVDMGGAGLIKLVGYAGRQDIRMTGAGSYNGYDLATQETFVELDGLGNAEVYATETLNAELNGVGSIKYRGNPASIEKEVNGLGVIKSYDEHASEQNKENI